MQLQSNYITASVNGLCSRASPHNWVRAYFGNMGPEIYARAALPGLHLYPEGPCIFPPTEILTVT